MKILKLLILSITALYMLGCNNDDTAVEATDTAIFKMNNTTYQIPKGITALDAKIEGPNAKIMTAGTSQDLAAFILEENSTNIPKSTLKSYKITQKGLATALTQLNSSVESIDKATLFSSQSSQTPYDFTIASYKITTNKEIEPLTLAGEILTSLAGKKTTKIPLSANNAPIATSFRLTLLYANFNKSSFYIAVLVPEKFFAKYKTVSSNITNAARVIPTGKSLQSTTQNFSQSTGKKNADILFVVDDSGSMRDDQAALSQAADDFSGEMINSGLTYRSAVITTGNGATNHSAGNTYRILRTAGIIENNTTLLKQSLVAGTGGSATETGIWNAEQALQALSQSDSLDGAVTKAGMPKINSTLSVVIISDERSQYRSRSNGTDFNVSDNLFKDRNIRVYSLIETVASHLSTTQYDDLSSETGGIHSDIENRSNGSLDFSGFMQQIAQDAGGAASSFVLTNAATVINDVKVNGTSVLEDTINGYTYVQSSRSIVFHGTAIPPSGATIVVNYDFY